MNKSFGNIEILDPSQLGIDENQDFFLPLYEECYRQLPSSADEVVPFIDFDALKNGSTSFSGLDHIVSSFDHEQIMSLRNSYKGVTKADDWRKDPARAAFTIFLHQYPELSHLIQNINIKTDLAIEAAAMDLQQNVSARNFMEFKRYLDKINRKRWTRGQTKSEEQGGVSGGINLPFQMILIVIIEKRHYFAIDL